MRSDTLFGRILLGILYICIVSIIIVATMYSISTKSSEQFKITLGGQEIIVAIADTQALQERGLSGQKSLNENEGMLFVFPAPVRTGFWMKDMFFPIDIIWFDTEQKIVDVWENATPDSYPEIRAPKNDIRYVLEVPAGFVHAHNVREGDKFELAQ